LQGLVTLTESRDEDGGFCTVPGFYKHLNEWCELTKDMDVCQRASGRFDFLNVPKEDPLIFDLANIPARAGALIIWRGEQPHCNYPNSSNRLRMNQYVKMLPAHQGAPGTEERTSMLKKMLPTDFQVSALGRKVFGLEKW